MSKHETLLRKLAGAFPEAEEGVSCGKMAFRAGGKSFFFLGLDEDQVDLMLKLGPSLKEAEQLEKKAPEHYSIGGHHWVRVRFSEKDKLPAALVKKWMEESYRLLVPKKITALLTAPKGKNSK